MDLTDGRAAGGGAANTAAGLGHNLRRQVEAYVSGPNIHERISANAITFADQWKAFQQELLSTFDSLRNKENARLLEWMDQLDGGVKALAQTVTELHTEVRQLRGELHALAGGLAIERGEAEARGDAG